MTLPSASVFGAARHAEAPLLQARLGFSFSYRHSCLHGEISDQHGPDIGAGLGNHQHADHGHRIRPQHHRDVKAKAQQNGQPHPAERPVLPGPWRRDRTARSPAAPAGQRGCCGRSPRRGSVGAEPLVLGHHAQQDAQPGQEIHGGGQTVMSPDAIPLPPDMVEQHIENCHGDGGDPLSQAQQRRYSFQDPWCTGHTLWGSGGRRPLRPAPPP